jgi:hypothetical protein
MAISALSYTADKWNGIYNTYLMGQDAADGGQYVWVDNDGNIIGEKDHPEVIDNLKWTFDKENNTSLVTSTYTNDSGEEKPVHKEKISRSALLLMGRNPNGANAGGKSDSWADP